jgi:hypothetical protein
MKVRLIVLALALILSFGAQSFAQDRSYKDGSVWTMSFIRVFPGQDETYLNSLKNSWKAVHDEAVKQGLILSYKILEGNATTPEDWNLILMVEYKNLASMEGTDEKWDAIQNKVSSADDRKKLMESRVSVRSMYGSRLMREIVYK